jgi:hypothetical protein
MATRRSGWTIGIVLTLFSGCALSGDALQGDVVVTVHGAHDTEELTLHGALKAMMRARSQATTGDTGDAAWLPDDGATDQRCVSDEEGHPVCCDGESAEGACCTHRGPSGDVRVCL